MANIPAHSLTQTTCAHPRWTSERAPSSRRLRILAGYSLAGGVSMAIWTMLYWLAVAVIG